MANPDLFIVRHGSYDRKHKHLTPVGLEIITQGARSFAVMLGDTANSTAIHSSPEVRATETAAVFAEELNVDPGQIVTSALLANSDYPPTREELVHGVREISTGTKMAHVLLVGHLEEVALLAGLSYPEVVPGTVFAVDIG
jgi:phosphohistidine phosphatase SixA